MSLIAKNIKKRFSYPDKIDLLKGIDLEVAKGESVAIIGRSGEGKSTLLHILGTLDCPTEGFLSIASLEANAANMNTIRLQHVGFVFQSFHLLEDYTVIQNVLMPSSIARQNVQKGSAAYQRAEMLLDLVGLSERKEHFGKQLSGGEKQRAAIARAMQNDPDLILADEPSGNLDRKTADQIHSLLLEFVKEKGKSLIVVTHDQELAALCDTRYELKEGVLHRMAT